MKVINLPAILGVLGLLMQFFSCVLLLPILTAWYYEEDTLAHFFRLFLGSLIIGSAVFFSFRHRMGELRVRDGFIITLLTWVLLSALAAIAFRGILPISIFDAVFEAVSAVTTTGSTVLVGLDDLPRSLLIYRQVLQWLGGMGLIVLAVAVLPVLDVGGMQLYRVETPGPVKDSKLAPRMRTTAATLYGIYVALTIACCLSYRLAGMGWFDAVAHSFSTVAIGGFSTHDASLGYFDSFAIELVAIAFMILSATNFALHFLMWHSRSLKQYWRDDEFRFYLSVLVIGVVALVVTLAATNPQAGLLESARVALFQGISYATTTGFSIAPTESMQPVPQILLLALPFIGGCAGSVGGGVKVVRVLLAVRQGFRELHRLIHPLGVYHIKLSGRIVETGVQEAVWGFLAFYILSFVLLCIAVGATGMDVHTAASSVTASLNNLGPGQGEVYANFSSVTDTAKCILAFAMLLGRLEVMTVLVLLTPVFWRS